jgi:uncharacterized protein YdhG (YjbR/CyaY superfamily)
MNVEDCIFNLNENERKIAEFLRNEILNLAMGVEEKIAYGLPFFTYLGPLCYLAPKKVGVDLGFMDGQQFELTKQYLNMDGRKRVGSLFYKNLESINFEILRQTLVEAIEFNQQKKNKRR